jgi:hypothetical protein
MDPLHAKYSRKEKEELLEAGPSAAAAAAPPRPIDAGARAVPLADVVEFTVSAKDSFESFLGRRYDPSEASWGLLGSALLSQEAVVPSHAAYERLAAHLAQRMGPRGEAPPRGAGGGPPPAALLSPLDRFAKLLAGLAGLQAELCEVEAANGGGGGGGVLRVLSDSVGVAQERLEALRPAAAAAAAAGARPAAARGAGGGPVAAPAPPGAQALRALLADVAALQEAQAAAAEANARVAALSAALGQRVKALAQSAHAAGAV